MGNRPARIGSRACLALLAALTACAAKREGDAIAQAPARPAIEFVGRVVDEHASPVRSTELVALLQTADDARWGRRIGLEGAHTDVDGAIVLGAPAQWVGSTVVLYLEHGDVAGRVIVGPLTEGRMDVGTIALVRGDVIVAGSVVDDRGEPLAGAYVELRRATEPDGALVVRARADHEGAFELRGPPVPGEIAILVRAPGHASALVPVVDRARAQSIALARTGDLVGRVVTAAGEPVRGVSVYCQGVDEERPWVMPSGRDGEFRFPGRALGVKRLWIEGLGMRVEVMVEPAVTTHAPDLVLPAEITPVELTFVDERGVEPPGLVVHVRRRERGAGAQSLRIDANAPASGARRGLLRREVLDVVALAPGRRAIVERNVSTSRTFTMAGAPRVRVRFEPPFALGRAAFALTSEVTMDRVTIRSAPIDIDEDRCEIEIGLWGVHDILLWRRLPNGALQSAPAAVAVGIDPDEPPTEIVVRLPPAVRAWIQRTAPDAIENGGRSRAK